MNKAQFSNLEELQPTLSRFIWIAMMSPSVENGGGRAVYIKCTKNVRRNLPELKDIFREIQLAKVEEMEIISFLYQRRTFPGTPYYRGERGKKPGTVYLGQPSKRLLTNLWSH